MIIEISNDFLTAKINSFGAELQSLVVNKTGREYIWFGKEDIWSGHSPILFPIIGRLLDDKYILDNKQYTLAKHGFARRNEFECVLSQKDKAVFSLSQTKDTLEVYPFCFRLEIAFELQENCLKVEHKIKNTNEKEMYFSFGAHPAFNVEKDAKIVFDQVETLSTLKVDDDGLRNGKEEEWVVSSRELPIDDKTFLDDALIFRNVRSDGGCLFEGDKKLLHFSWGDVPYLGFWAKPGAPYVCIEPWWGVNDSQNKKDDFSKKTGIQSLKQGEEFSYCWTAEIF